MTETKSVGIYIFDEVEVLDFTGPFEVFSVAGRPSGEALLNVFTVAQEQRPIMARNQLSVNPGYSFLDCPPVDLLVVPGGRGTRKEMHKPEVLEWIRQKSSSANLVLSVCSGSLILGKAGLLDGMCATTHHLAFTELQEAAPTATLFPGKRFVDSGRIITAAGVSAGIDTSLYIIERLFGRERAEETARYIEYSLECDVCGAPNQIRTGSGSDRTTWSD
jgi:transcriptional regulator GlxA family with amidase domain